jgi:hypothetical protein
VVVLLSLFAHVWNAIWMCLACDCWPSCTSNMNLPTQFCHCVLPFCVLCSLFCFGILAWCCMVGLVATDDVCLPPLSRLDVNNAFWSTLAQSIVVSTHCRVIVWGCLVYLSASVRSSGLPFNPPCSVSLCFLSESPQSFHQIPRSGCTIYHRSCRIVVYQCWLPRFGHPTRFYHDVRVVQVRCHKERPWLRVLFVHAHPRASSIV